MHRCGAPVGWSIHICSRVHNGLQLWFKSLVLFLQNNDGWGLELGLEFRQYFQLHMAEVGFLPCVGFYLCSLLAYAADLFCGKLILLFCLIRVSSPDCSTAHPTLKRIKKESALTTRTFLCTELIPFESTSWTREPGR